MFIFVVVFNGVVFLCRFHLGTLAFGSLIIAIIQMIRIVLEYIDRKVRGKENKVAQFILW